MSIYRMNPEVEQSMESEDTEVATGFTSGKLINDRNVSIDQDNNDCYAKIIDFFIRENNSPNNTKRSSYYLKFGVDGFIYDPWGIYSEGTQHKQASHAGKMAWSFRKVNKKCFDLYLLYLSSKNKSYLYNVEREARNG